MILLGLQACTTMPGFGSAFVTRDALGALLATCSISSLFNHKLSYYIQEELAVLPTFANTVFFTVLPYWFTGKSYR
jgi:hypothetical protein